MNTNELYSYMHKQVPVIMVLSLLPGLGYIFLGWLNGIYISALFWYLAVVVISIKGYQLYRSFELGAMSESQLTTWYKSASLYFYLFFALWGIIFLIYIPESKSGMHYIAIFTELGASTVAASILFPDKKLYRPTVIALMLPLVIYFLLIGKWYGYVLSAFAATFTWVLLYTATNSNALFTRTIFQSTHDYLTGLFNRQYFIEFIQKKMNSIKYSGEYTYLLLIDLDHFKTVNDSLGHDVGDTLLLEVVNRIESHISENAMAARLGGDEFIITGENYKDKDACREKAIQISYELLAALKSTYHINQHHLFISASIGVSLIDASENSAGDFIKEADIAMYEVKAKGRDGVFVFDETMSERVEHNLKLERLLHFAAEKKQIHLVYQPQVDAFGKVSGAEVLARWSCEELGEVLPVEFIAIAEQTGLIIEIGRHIMESAFITLKEWNDKGIDIGSLSINISVRQFMHYQFVEDVTALCNKYLDKKMMTKVVFEITESVVAEGANIIERIESLKSLGIRISMDDFGTGYSSLSYIRRLPIDEIKIDRQFVKDLSRYSNAEEMIDTILNIAKIFNLSVVAEGVETEEQNMFLLEHGCEIFQGYLYSRPVAKDEFEKFYLERNQE